MDTNIVQEKAVSKQETITGGDVNYYLISVSKSEIMDVDPYVAEVEDIIEALNMEFAEGTVLKSLVRLCKLNQNLGKPGSSKKYEIEKIRYYADRIVSKAEQYRDVSCDDIVSDNNTFYNDQSKCDSLEILRPKRLSPYKMYFGDITNSLNMTIDEKNIFENLMVLCKVIKSKNLVYETYKYHADIIKLSAGELKF
jgi:hypothetical protein